MEPENIGLEADARLLHQFLEIQSIGLKELADRRADCRQFGTGNENNTSANDTIMRRHFASPGLSPRPPRSGVGPRQGWNCLLVEPPPRGDPRGGGRLLRLDPAGRVLPGPGIALLSDRFANHDLVSMSLAVLLLDGKQKEKVALQCSVLFLQTLLVCKPLTDDRSSSSSDCRCQNATDCLNQRRLHGRIAPNDMHDVLQRKKRTLIPHGEMNTRGLRKTWWPPADTYVSSPFGSQ